MNAPGAPPAQTGVRDSQRFPLAKMSRAIRGLTLFLLAVPIAFIVLAVSAGASLAWPALLVAGLYLAVWLAARPACFEVDPSFLHVCFPLWTRRIPRASLAAVRPIEARALRGELGFALRVGVGGLWGAFGWLWSRRRGWIELYVSRSDGLVWIERRGAVPLLITPQRPAQLAASLAPVPS